MTLKKVFFYALLLFMLGVFLVLKHQLPGQVVFCTFFAALLLLVCSFLKPKIEKGFCYASLLLFFFSLGAFVADKADDVKQNSIYHFVGQKGVITGSIRPYTYKNYEEEQASFLLEANSFYFNGENHQVTGNIRMSVHGMPAGEHLESGTVLSVGGQIRPVRSLANPGGFDMMSYDYQRDIYGRMSVKYSNIVVVAEKDEGIQVKAEIISRKLKQNIDGVLPANEKAIIVGMLFGGYDGIERSLIKEFSITGIIHILAVSGAHVAIITCFLLWLGRWKRSPFDYKKIVIFTMLVIIFFAFLTGLRVPVLRAVIMAIFVLAGQLFDRKADSGSILGLVFLLCLIYQPLWLLDVSFQLSFLSALAIIYLYPKIKEKTTFLPEFIGAACALTFAVQITLLPFLASYFYQISGVAFLANIFVLPIAEICIIISFFGLPFFYLWQPLGSLLFVLMSLILGIFLRFNSFFAGLPFAVFTVPYLPEWVWLAYYVIVLSAFDFLPVKLSAKKRVCLCMGALAFTLLFLHVNVENKGLSVHFVDVGQGDACLLITEQNKAIIIDTGPRGIYGGYDSGERIILPYLKHYGINRIELLVLSHGHNDHAGGAAALAKEMTIKELWLPKERLHDDVERLLINAKNSRKVTMERGLKNELDGVTVEVIYAPEFVAQKKTLESSSFIKVTYKNRSILFTGDAPMTSEIKAMTYLDKIDVLKVAHHGAESSSNAAFIDKINPGLAIISVSRDNSYGHPSPEVIRRLHERGIKIARTDEQGAILVRVKDDKIHLYSYRADPEFFKR